MLRGNNFLISIPAAFASALNFLEFIAMSESFEESVIEQMTGTHPDTAQPESQEPSQSANIDWEGNPKYFQKGQKAGQLKPSFRDGAGAVKTKSKDFAGLDLDKLRATETVNSNTDSPSAPVDAKSEKARKKEERKSSDARVGAKIAMRILNLVVKWISGGDYGKDFTPQQTKERNAYAEELESDWREYLLTLDIPLHPALIVAFGSITYVGDAFATEKGQEKVKSIKERIFGKVGMMMFAGGKK